MSYTSNGSSGPIGYIYHWSSKKVVQPRGGSCDPAENTDLVLRNFTNPDSNRLTVQQMRFIPTDAAGHFGFIEHVASGKVVHHKWDRLHPKNDTSLVLHSGRHAGALFGFDEDNMWIMYKGEGNMIWHPYGGYFDPPDNTVCVVHPSKHDGAKFYFGDVEGNPISPYPEPYLSGEWKIIKALLDSQTARNCTVKYNIGRSRTMPKAGNAWNISSKAAYDLFTSSTEFTDIARNVDNSTWSDEKEDSTEIKVEKGQTLVIWQFVFGISQYDEEWTFRSNVIGDTDGVDKKPSVWNAD